MRRALACLTLFSIASVACRSDRPASQTDIVMQLLTMRDALGVRAVPTTGELQALAPFLSASLTRALASADSQRTAERQRVPGDKPPFADGDVFSSMIEGPTAFRVMPALDSVAPVRVPIEFSNDAQRPAARWTDTAVVVQQAGKWVVNDLRYGATWPFANKGTLLTTLDVSRTP